MGGTTRRIKTLPLHGEVEQASAPQFLSLGRTVVTGPRALVGAFEFGSIKDPKSGAFRGG